MGSSDILTPFLHASERSATQNILPSLQFHVSLNEEHVFLRMVPTYGGAIDLGERVHHYCLVTLARQRLHDARRGIDPSSQGWLAVEQLAKMLGLEATHLNIQIYRARQHIASALPPGVDGSVVVERRRGEIRYGALPFRIVMGSRIEGEFAPSQDLGPDHLAGEDKIGGI